jgi:hypothetical protein
LVNNCFVFVSLVLSTKKRSSHSKIGNQTSGQETCDNEVDNSIVIDIQLSNNIYGIAEVQGIYS